MKIGSANFDNNQPIPSTNAFCAPDPNSHVTMSSNKNPALSWKDVPAGTKSFVLICHDPDVPSQGDNVNQEGKTIPADLPRIDFHHWVLIDLPATATGVEEGEYSDGVTAGGKDGPTGPNGTHQGVNDYTDWFAGDAGMGGDYYGYDGPCPPWNDTIVHHYVFTLYALDVERCPADGKFTGAHVREAIAGHVLAEASVTGTYSLNPDVNA